MFWLQKCLESKVVLWWNDQIIHCNRCWNTTTLNVLDKFHFHSISCVSCRRLRSLIWCKDLFSIWHWQLADELYRNILCHNLTLPRFPFFQYWLNCRWNFTFLVGKNGVQRNLMFISENQTRELDLIKHVQNRAFFTWVKK